MRLFKILMLTSIVLLGCKKTVETIDIISDVQINPNEVLADGSSLITITAILNKDLDKRSVMFRADNGSFVDSPTSGSIKITASKINDVLTAVAKLKAPSVAGDIKVTVQPDILDAEGKYVVERVISVKSSVPAKLTLTANAFSVYNEFNGEIELTGVLSSSKDKAVSKDIKVVIEDYDSNFNRISGEFRKKDLITKSDSKVSATYTPGNIMAGQYIYLVATVLDAAGNKTNISDTIKIYVTKKE